MSPGRGVHHAPGDFGERGDGGLSTNNKKRVVVHRGWPAISPLGHDWAHGAARSCESGVNRPCGIMRGLGREYEGSEHPGRRAGHAPFELPKERFNRKSTMRSMGRVSALMACRVTAERALEQAGSAGRPVGHQRARWASAYGSVRRASPSSRSADFLPACSRRRRTEGINATTYIKMMSAHRAGEHRRVSSASRAAWSPPVERLHVGLVRAMGYAFEAVQSRDGRSAMVAGGAEELDASAGRGVRHAVSPRACATTTAPRRTPTALRRRARDGLVLGEGAGSADPGGARTRGGARRHGACTRRSSALAPTPTARTCDRNPRPRHMMRQAMRLALERRRPCRPTRGGLRERRTAPPPSRATWRRARPPRRCSASAWPVSPRSRAYMGHTLGACGALEAWMSD
jgi:3-oxoacyl-(acyl-carrier-protein) synthase